MTIPMRFLSYLTTFLIAGFLVACGGGGGSAGTSSGSASPSAAPPASLFTTAPATLTVGVGSAQEFTIGGGTSPYTAVSNNAAVAIAGVKDARLTLGGVINGTAEITIRDAAGASVIVSMIVSSGPVRPLYTTATSSVTIAPGLSGIQTYQVGGGAGPYNATSSNVSIASVVLTGDVLKVTGLASGSTNIVVMDSLGATVSVAVTVPTLSSLGLFTTAPSSVTVAIGVKSAYSVGGGTSPYTATSSNAGVAKVDPVVGNSLIITGLAIGDAIVLVRDSAGASVTVNVSVGTIALAVTPNSATGIIDDVLVATITGGTPPFRPSVGNILVALATVENNNELTIRLRQVGQTIVTVLDANNQSVAYSLTSNAATPGIRLSPGTVTVSENDTQPILFNVFGAATGALSVFSSNITLLQAAVNANVVTVTTGTQVNRCVDADTPVTITVVDSTRAVGVATVTIQDNITCAAVALSTSAGTATSIGVMATRSFTVTGGFAPYSIVTSNSDVVGASISGNSMSMTGGRLAGSAIVTVRDSAGTPVSITVTVIAPPLATTAGGTTTVGIGATRAYSVTGGVQPYSVASANAATATATISPTTLNLDSSVLNLAITGVAAGTTTITVTDGAGTAIPITVTVQ